jgi:hypothetical protein
VFIGGEVDHRIEFTSDCAERDLMAIPKEPASSSADRLWQAALDTQPKRFSVAALEDAIARSRVDFGQETNAGCRQTP